MTDKGPVKSAQGSGRPPIDLKELTADRVVDYLKGHPDFLVDHPSLLEIMTPPRRAAGNVVDFQHAMVQRLKTENEKLQAAQDYLIGTARSNQSIQSRVHDAVLAILRAPSFESMIQTVTGDLAIQLDVDAVRSEEHTSELQSLMRISYAVFCL